MGVMLIEGVTCHMRPLVDDMGTMSCFGKFTSNDAPREACSNYKKIHNVSVPLVPRAGDGSPSRTCLILDRDKKL